MFRKPANNIAMRLLSLVGLTHLFQSAVPQFTPDMMPRKHGRPGRNVGVHLAKKDEFAKLDERVAVNGYQGNVFGRRLYAHEQAPVAGLRRKAHLGTLTIPSGRRGLQVKRVSGTGRKSVYRLTA